MDYFLRVLRNPRSTQERRDMAAKQLMAYMHRSLKSIEHTGEGGGPIEVRWLDSSE